MVREVRGVREVLVVLAAFSSGSAYAQTTNPRAVAEAAMMRADRDFNRAAADRDMTRFLSLVADDAKFDSADGLGKAAIEKAWAPLFDPNGRTRLQWDPTKAEALIAGDVGYTIGSYERHTTDAQGKEIVRRGQYLTIWRKQKDGVWRATFDTGSPAP